MEEEDGWNKRDTIALVSFIRKSPCLWHPKHPDFASKSKRKKQYLKILHRMLKLKGDLTVKCIKRKWKSLEHQLWKDHRHIKVYEGSADGGYAQHWLYNHLSFLLKHARERLAYTSVQELDNTETATSESEPEKETIDLEAYKNEGLDDNWSRLHTILLINLYKSCTSLWNKTDPEYKNFLKRKKQYELIAQEMVKIKPDVTVLSVRRKVRSLQTQFRRDWKGSTWCHKYLTFLSKSEEKIDTVIPDVDESDDTYSNIEILNEQEFVHIDNEAYDAATINTSNRLKLEETLNQADTVALIDLFKKCPCLWNSHHPDYKDRVKQKQHYQYIAQELSLINGGVTIHTVKQKLKTLLSQFRRELSSFEYNGQEHEPKLWCYQHFSFLLDETAQYSDNDAYSEHEALQDVDAKIAEYEDELTGEFNLELGDDGETSSFGTAIKDEEENTHLDIEICDDSTAYNFDMEVGSDEEATYIEVKEETNNQSCSDNGVDNNDSGTAEDFWSRKATIALIDLFKQYPCLWNSGHIDFTNKLKRKQYYEQIVYELLKVKEDVTVRSVKKKLKSLQTNLWRVWSQARSSKSGVQSSIWYYNRLSFLLSRNEAGATYSNIELDAKSNIVSTTTVEDEWSETETIKLIGLYRKSSCLWNTKDPNYKNQLQMKKQYNCIVDEMAKAKRGVTVKAVKEKLETLLSQWQEEQSKVTLNGSTYESSWWCYEHLSFLLASNKQQATSDIEIGSDYEAEDEDDGPSETNKESRNNKHNITNKKLIKLAVETLEYSKSFLEQSQKPLTREEEFCGFLCSELKKIKSDDIFDNLKYEILAMVNETTQADASDFCTESNVSEPTFEYKNVEDV